MRALAEPGIRRDTDVRGPDAGERAKRWNREFEGTSWIAFACAGFLLLFFVSMLVINETTDPACRRNHRHRLGGFISSASGCESPAAEGRRRPQHASARTRRNSNAGGRPTWGPRGQSC